MRTTTLMLILALALAACGGDGETAAGASVDADLVAAGADRYATYCAACHGLDLRGTGNGPSFLSRVYEPGHHADISFLLAVQRGVPAHHWSFGDMPPVDGVDEQDVAAIVAFVRDSQDRLGFEPYPP